MINCRLNIFSFYATVKFIQLSGISNGIKMKKIFALLLMCTLFIAACNKNTNSNALTKDSIIQAAISEGTITGMDGRKCACCWGWLIKIDGKEYKFDKIPETSSLDINNISYPKTVKIEWQDAQGDCSGQLIEVINISPL